MQAETTPELCLIGRTLGAGKYRVDAYIGGGAMGAVYRAEHLALKAPVALKVMNPGLSRDVRFVERFRREALAASRVDHLNSLRVLDAGEEADGTLYIVMEYVEGTDLGTLARAHQESPLPPARIAGLLGQVCAALAVAHEKGIVHRDLKPENILVQTVRDDEGNVVDRVRVCDFGIAQLMDAGEEGRSSVMSLAQAERRITLDGHVVGTPEYLSPEQAAGHPVDPRSDIYSLGVILYELLTGQVPFKGDSAVAVMTKHVQEAPVRPSVLRPDVDGRLELICLRAMHKETMGRYPTARHMRTELRAVELGRAHYVSERPAAGTMSARSALAELREPPRSRRARRLGLSVLGAVLLLGGVALIRSQAVGAAARASAAEILAAPQNTAALPPPPPLPIPTPSGSAAAPVAPPAPQIDEARAVREDERAPVAAAATGGPASANAAATPTIRRGRPHDRLVRELPPEPAVAPPAPVAPVVAGPAVPPPLEPLPAPAPVPAAAHYTPGEARVVVEGVRTLGAPREAVLAAVDVAALTRCYRTSLVGVTERPRPARRTVHLATDEGGMVTTVNFAGWPPASPAAEACMMHIFKGRAIDAPNFGAVTADIDISFQP